MPLENWSDQAHKMRLMHNESNGYMGEGDKHTKFDAMIHDPCNPQLRSHATPSIDTQVHLWGCGFLPGLNYGDHKD